MKKRVRLAVMRLALIQEEFTKSELDEAASFLSNRSTDDVIEILQGSQGDKGYSKCSVAERRYGSTLQGSAGYGRKRSGALQNSVRAQADDTDRGGSLVFR